MSNQFTPAELTLIMRVFGDRHKDKDISEEESVTAFSVYNKSKKMCQPATTKKIKSKSKK